MRIRTKLLLALLVVGLLPLTFLTWVGYKKASHAMRDRTIAHLSAVASVQEQRLQAIIDQNLERLRLVSSRTQMRLSLRRFIEEGTEDDRDKIGRIIADARRSIDGLDGIMVYDQEGELVQAVGENSDTARPDFVFNRSQGGEEVIDGFYLREDGTLGVYLAGPLTLDDEQIGVIIIASSGDRFNQLAATTDGLGDTGETCLVGSLDGVTAFLTPLRFGDAPTANNKTLSARVVRNTALMKTPEIAGFFDYRGEKVFASFRFLPDADVAVLVKLDWDEVFEPIRNLRNFFLVTMLTSAALTLALALRFARSLTKPDPPPDGICWKDCRRRLLAPRHRFDRRRGRGVGRRFQPHGRRLTEANRGLEERVEERTAELERSNRDLEQFAYVASHDLKEPLRTVTSYVQLLEKRYADKLDDDARDFIGMAVDGTGRMSGLIDGLLKFSRLTTQGDELQAVPLAEPIGMAQQQLAVALDEAQAVINVGDGMPTIRGDRTQLAQLFQNLIGNAIKFREPDTVPEVSITARKKDGDCDLWVISVADNGIGIEPEYADRVFQIFQRLHTRDEYAGTGIGLALCRRIVERHGGDIWLEKKAEEETGATFSFTLHGATETSEADG